MAQICLKIYMTELQKHHGELLYEWLLERAKALGIPGGSAYRAIAGYGRHGTLHEEGFFELANDVPVQLEFVVNEEQASRLLSLLKTEQLRLVYTRSPIDSGVS
jgi:PII-like signaling protein